jgi:hypothetical protein
VNLDASLVLINEINRSMIFYCLTVLVPGVLMKQFDFCVSCEFLLRFSPSFYQGWVTKYVWNLMILSMSCKHYTLCGGTNEEMCFWLQCINRLLSHVIIFNKIIADFKLDLTDILVIILQGSASLTRRINYNWP